MNDFKNEIYEIRKYCIDNIKELTKEFKENAENNGISVHICKSLKDAKILVGRYPGKYVVMSKTTYGDELFLPYFRTDLGEYIAWKLGLKKKNPILPLEGYDLDFILKSFNCKSAEELKEKVKNEVKNKILDAHIGITGANALVSDGSIYLVENEGNIANIITREKLVVITNNSRIYPSHEFAIKCIKKQIEYSTGQKISSYIHIIGGPSQSADLFTKMTGMYGTKDIEVVLLDISNHPFLEIFMCINCGNCIRHCPIFKHKTFGGYRLGGRGILMHQLEKEAYLCTLCGACKRACPVGINIPELIIKFRNILENKGKNNELVRNSILSDKQDDDLFYCC